MKESSDNFGNDLGEPKSVSRYEENGYTFEKTEWENQYGTIVSVEMISSPFETSGIKKELQLEKQLILAVDEERYEDAAKIRDEINKKSSINEVTDNGDVNSINDWNF